MSDGRKFFTQSRYMVHSGRNRGQMDQIPSVYLNDIAHLVKCSVVKPMVVLMGSHTFFVSLSFLPRAARAHSSQVRWVCSHVKSKGDTARGRRRAAGQARVAAHLELKNEIDARRRTSENICNIYISVPPYVRDRCGLTNRLARVKSVMDREDVLDISKVRHHLFTVLRRLFPELERYALLRHDQDFDIKSGGKSVSLSNSLIDRALPGRDSISSLFVEVVPHNLPPPISPLSKRWEEAQKKVKEAMNNSAGLLRMVSFFKFTPISNPQELSARLKKFWRMLGIVGRVYVAEEGINAQMAVPQETWPDFVDAMNGKWTERKSLLVPDCIVGVFLNLDGSVARSEQPFDVLHVRAREKVLADGLSNTLNWSQAGREVCPQEWHDLLKKKPKDSILVDCRNQYESEVGRFEGAEMPNTTSFRDTFKWLEERFKNVEKNAPILTYCTGGIRCVKVNAYLEQEMGFTNTQRLSGGIVSYARSLAEKGEMEDSRFLGINHVFDGRVGRSVTNHELSRCLNCGQPCSIQTDCAYVRCNRPFDTRMFIQCPDCAARLRGTCSTSCYESIAKASATAEAVSPSIFQVPYYSQASSDLGRDRNMLYAEQFSSGEDVPLQNIREATETLFPGRKHMLSGAMQGAFLAMLVKISNSSRVLELGTFTGYSALYMARALPGHGQLVSCEIEEEVLQVARKHIEKDNSLTVNLLNLPAMTVLERFATSNDEPFDMVFVDANKGGYREYYEFMLTNDIIRKGGIIVFDNVLFKSLVAEEWLKLEDSSRQEAEIGHSPGHSPEEHKMIRSRQRSIRKAHKIARKMHEFNKFVHDDMRTEQVLLPVRDGLLVVRRK